MRKKDTSPIPANHIEELLEEHGKHGNWLAEEIGVSPAHMSRMINGVSRIPPTMAKKISDAFDVDPDKVVDYGFKKKSADSALLGQALSWVLEAAQKKDVELSHEAASRLAIYIHDKALADPLNFTKTKDLTFTAIDIIRLARE